MILQRDGSPGHSLHSIYDFCLLSAGIWRGEQKAAKTKPFLGSPRQQWATKEANQLPINTDRARSCLSCIRQLQAEISAVRSGTGRVSATARDSRKAARLTPRPALHS